MKKNFTHFDHEGNVILAVQSFKPWVTSSYQEKGLLQEYFSVESPAKEMSFHHMRRKELNLIVTFHTTTQAIAMEKYCKVMNIPGRLIPVPVKITSGCGMAWMANLQYQEEIKAFVERFPLEVEALHEIEV